jgi:hypothetical protein
MGKENKTWGVSGLYRHYFFKNDTTGDSVLKRVRDHWEELRRYPQYLELCEGVEFHKSGIVSNGWLAQNGEKHDEINKRLNQMRIKQLLDPKKSFFELPPDITLDIIGPNPVEVIALKDPPPLVSKIKNPANNIFLKTVST